LAVAASSEQDGADRFCRTQIANLLSEDQYSLDPQ
jgi:hypothetical protein